MRISKSLQHKIKLASVLYDKKTRIKEKCLILEGIRIIETAIISNLNIDYILYTKKLLSNNRGVELLENCQRDGIECDQITPENMDKISQTESTQGIIAVAELREYDINNFDLNKEQLFIVVLDNIQDPGNVGTIIRTADSSGADAVFVAHGCVDIYNPKTIRSSMGAIFSIPVIKIENLKKTIAQLKNAHVKIIATDLKAKMNYFDFQYKNKLAILLGNEAQGLKSDLISLTDISIKIPIFGNSESLNVASAASIIMYEKVRQNWKS